MAYNNPVRNGIRWASKRHRPTHFSAVPGYILAVLLIFLGVSGGWIYFALGGMALLSAAIITAWVMFNGERSNN